MDTVRNFWTERAADLRKNYAHFALGNSVKSLVRFELVTRALVEVLPPEQKIVDVGGGFGLQAIILSRHGHTVTIVDSDEVMVQAARRLLSFEPSDVRDRVSVVHCHGENAPTVVGSEYDLVCCHSVLMYLDEPRELIRSICSLIRLGGQVSLLSLNHDAIAMRSGLQGSWKEACDNMVKACETNAQYAPSRKHRLTSLTDMLRSAGIVVTKWYGVGVFTDHLSDLAGTDDEIDKICELEWLAGSRDPYRQVARSIHLLGERVA